MNFNYPFRVKLGICLIILFALFSNIRMGIFEKDALVFRSATGKAYISEYLERYEALKAILPRDRIVGYITDKDFEIGGYINKTISDIDYELIAGYCLTQYALAPIIVENNINHALVIGNFHYDIANTKLQDLVLIKYFGEGVALFKNKEK